MIYNELKKPTNNNMKLITILGLTTIALIIVCMLPNIINAKPIEFDDYDAADDIDGNNTIKFDYDVEYKDGIDEIFKNYIAIHKKAICDILKFNHSECAAYCIYI